MAYFDFLLNSGFFGTTLIASKTEQDVMDEINAPLLLGIITGFTLYHTLLNEDYKEEEEEENKSYDHRLISLSDDTFDVHSVSVSIAPLLSLLRPFFSSVELFN